MKEKAKAIVYYGFDFKENGFLEAKNRGFKIVLLDVNPKEEAENHFDEVFDLAKLSDMDLKDVLLGKYDVHGVITNYERYIVHRSHYADLLGVNSVSLDDSFRTFNKFLQRSGLEGVESNVEHKVVSRFDEALKYFVEMGEDVYLKVLSGWKSKFVFHVRSKEELKNAFDMFFENISNFDTSFMDSFEDFALPENYLDHKKYLLMEKAVYGSQVSTVSFVSNDEVFVCPSLIDIYTAQDIGIDDGFLAFRIVKSKFDDDIYEKVVFELKQIIERFGIRNSAQHTEFFVTEEGSVKLVEITSRLGGYRDKMFDFAYGLDLDQILIDAALGKFSNYDFRFKKFVAVHDVFARKTGRFLGIENLDLLKNDENVLNVKEYPQKLGKQIGKAKEGFGPALVFYLSGDSYEEVYEKSLFYQEKLRVVVE